MSDYEIKDESSNHHYRTELPNIIFEIGLPPHLIGVYAAIKKCAGDGGSCFKSEKTLSKELNISKSTLHKYIESLCLLNEKLNKSLISKENRISKDGDKDTNSITINDIWPENYMFFHNKVGGRVNSTLPRVNSTQGVGYILPKGRVNSTHKEEPIKKNPIKNPPPSVPKNMEEVAEVSKEDKKKMLSLIEDSKKKGFPFSEASILAISKITSGWAVQQALIKFSKRSKKLPDLDLPDRWLKKNAIEEHELQLQKKEI